MARTARRRQVSPARIATARDRLLADPATDPGTQALLRQIDLSVSPHDSMFPGDPERYLRFGAEALRIIDRALDGRSPRTILDFACGHGRVLRFLTVRYPQAAITASDSSLLGTRFCARRFGANPLRAPSDPAELVLPESYELIWCGSLLTHLDAERTHSLLAAFANGLTTRGTAVVTTHGARVAAGPADLSGVTPDLVEELMRSYRETGFGWAPYPRGGLYGFSIANPEWIDRAAKRAGLAVMRVDPAAWAGFQDVYVLKKTRT